MDGGQVGVEGEQVRGVVAEGGQQRLPVGERAGQPFRVEGGDDAGPDGVDPVPGGGHGLGVGPQHRVVRAGRRARGEVGGDRLPPLGVTEEHRGRSGMSAQQFAQHLRGVHRLGGHQHRPAAVHGVQRGGDEGVALAVAGCPGDHHHRLGTGAPDHVPLRRAQRQRRQHLLTVGRTGPVVVTRLDRGGTAGLPPVDSNPRLVDAPRGRVLTVGGVEPGECGRLQARSGRPAQQGVAEPAGEHVPGHEEGGGGHRGEGGVVDTAGRLRDHLVRLQSGGLGSGGDPRGAAGGGEPARTG
ncbi:hypothetical protein MRQ36_25545 [Micromonospora sp. R77]|uniref:hypothetical protein n=1 Tax=Micromonospora sp. R77 TaxID=2925836 RepID=UPI001F606DD3|nr:hypothetical protein [Micromonospora sp. R77]MCI4065739.1 hypothetical protein [Micromonospora sp. R77]